MCILCDPSRLEEARALRYIDCPPCTTLTRIPDGLDRLRALNIWDCPGLVAFPESMPNLERLDIRRCARLDRLPAQLPKLTHLTCRSNPHMDRLPESMPLLRLLEVTFMPLRHLPPVLPNLLQLHIEDCPALRATLANYPLLGHLKCSILFDEIESIKTRLTWLECRGVDRLPDGMTNLETLSVFKSPRFTLPTGLTGVRHLFIRDCDHITVLPPDLDPTLLIRVGFPIWIRHPLNARYHASHLDKLCTLQRYVRLRRFVRLTSSLAFNEHFFSPDQPGERWALARLAKRVSK